MAETSSVFSKIAGALCPCRCRSRDGNTRFILRPAGINSASRTMEAETCPHPETEKRLLPPFTT